MAKTLTGGGASPKPTASAGAAKPPVDLTSPNPMGGSPTDMPIATYNQMGGDTSGPATADPNKKKKPDWQMMIKSGLQGAANGIDNQADPMAIMQQLQSLAASSRGQIIQ